MKRYSEYKDSGVKWIGEIPGHWKRSRFKFEAKTNSGSTPKNIKGRSYDDSNITWIRTTDLTNSYVYSSSELLTYNEFKSASCPWLPKDTLLIAMYGGAGTIGKCGLMGVEGTINQALCSLEINSKHSEIYFLYLAQTMRPVWMEYANSSRKDPNISQEIIRNAYIPLPPLPEQEAIVTHLDSKVAKIDEYISIAEKKIAALEELKQTIIAEAVTRGIHKDVPMKDSGVKWIGMIPEHWKIMRLRFVCEFRNGYTPSKANPKFWENGTIPWFRMEDIRDSGRFLNEAKQYISKEAVKGDGLFEAGSFILATTATIGEHAMLIADSLANQQFTNLKIRKSLISKLSRNFFFYYLFVIDEYCKSTTRKATFPSVDMTDLKNIGVSIPPIEEQQEIVTYLDSKVANINQLCQAERSQIEKLKEYKQRLISDVVTGKVKVTND